MLFNIEWVRPQHLKSIRTQMEREEEGKVTIKMIPDLTDVSKWKDRGTVASMSKHFHVLKTLTCLIILGLRVSPWTGLSAAVCDQCIGLK